MHKITLRVLSLIAILVATLPLRSNGGDILEMKPEEYKKAEAMMRHWLSLADKGKYEQGFAEASELFRQNSSVEKWTAEHRKMRDEYGSAMSRGKIDYFSSPERATNTTLPSYYFVHFKTKFKKKSGTEEVQIAKENGEWKVSSYRITPGP